MHKKFESLIGKPEFLFFDLDKNKYQIANDAPMDNDIEALKTRRSCQEYNQSWLAFSHGVTYGKQLIRG